MIKTIVVNCKVDKYDVFIGRPSVFGNPFIIGEDGKRKDVIEKYFEWLKTQQELVFRIKNELPGKVLGCFCSPQKCHGDILAEIANGEIEI